MKRIIAVALALVMLFALVACADKEEAGVTVTNRTDVDLVDVKVGISDGSVNGIILAESLKKGESVVLSLSEVCNDTEGTVNITAFDEDGNAFAFNNVVLYDGVAAVLEGGGDRTPYLSYPYNDSTAQYSGVYLPVEPDETTGGGGETPIPDGTEDYVGIWMIHEEGYLQLNTDGTYALIAFDGQVSGEGRWSFDGGAVLELGDGESVTLVLDSHGELDGGEEVGFLVRVDDAHVVTEADFIGYWQYRDGGDILEITEDGWYLYGEDGVLEQYGLVGFDVGCVILMNEYGSSGGGTLYINAYGELDDYGEVLEKLDAFPYGNGGENMNDELLGEWLYSGHQYVLTFDGTEHYVLDSPDGVESGTYSFDGERIEFYKEGDLVAAAQMTDEGVFIIDGDAGSFFHRRDY